MIRHKSGKFRGLYKVETEYNEEIKLLSLHPINSNLTIALIYDQNLLLETLRQERRPFLPSLKVKMTKRNWS